MKIIAEYKEALEQLKRLSEEEDLESERFDRKRMEVVTKFDAQIDELKSARLYAANEIQMEKEEMTRIATLKGEPYHAVTTKVNRLLKLIHVQERGYDMNYEVYSYQMRYTQDHQNPLRSPIQPIYTLCGDELKSISLYIVENDKPKNKYTLIAAGSSLVAYSDLLKIPHSTWVDAHTDGCNIQLSLKSLPSKEELVTWMDKRKQTLLKNLLEEIYDLEIEYKKAIQLHKKKEWKIFYLENRKQYYEECYCRGTETPEYKEVLKKLKELRKEEA